MSSYSVSGFNKILVNLAGLFWLIWRGDTPTYRVPPVFVAKVTAPHIKLSQPNDFHFYEIPPVKKDTRHHIVNKAPPTPFSQKSARPDPTPSIYRKPPVKGTQLDSLAKFATK